MNELFGAYLPFQLYTFMCFNQINIRVNIQLIFFNFKFCKVISFNLLEIDQPIADSKEIRLLIDNNFKSYYYDICGYLFENLNSLYLKKTFAI